MSQPNQDAPAAKRSKLDVVANVAIIVTCLIAAVVLVRREFFPPRPEAPPGSVAAGEQLDVLHGALPAANRTLVIAVAPGCHFCNDSMPFYKHLLEERDSSHSPVKVVAAVSTPEAQADEQTKMSANGVKPDAFVHVDFRQIKVPGTPTVLLVDGQGKVLSVWMGKLDERGEHEVLKTL